MGDLNADCHKKNDQKGVKDLFTVNGYTQLLKSPIRVTKETSTLIDVILANNPRNIADNELIAAGLSDHNLIACIRKMNNIKFKSTIITFRDYSYYDVNDVNNILLSSNWDTVYNALTPDQAFNNLKSMLLNVLDIHAPVTSKKVKGKPSPWLDADVKKHMNTRDKLLRKAQKSKLEPDWKAYRKLKNFVINLIKRTERNFFKNKLEESRSKPDKFWKTVKEVFLLKNQCGERLFC